MEPVALAHAVLQRPTTNEYAALAQSETPHLTVEHAPVSGKNSELPEVPDDPDAPASPCRLTVHELEVPDPVVVVTFTTNAPLTELYVVTVPAIVPPLYDIITICPVV